MKQEFEKAEVEIIRFEKDDVIATSGPGVTTEQMQEEDGEL